MERQRWEKSGAEGGLIGHSETVSLIGEVNVLLRHRSLLIVLPMLMSVGAIALTLIRGREYRAESRFTPQTEETGASRLAGLAAQFGISLSGSSSPNQSVDFYSELLRSRDLLRSAATTQYRFATKPGGSDTISGTLIDLYNAKGNTSEDRVLMAVDILDKRIEVGTGLRRAGVVTLTTTARWPDLAVQINRRLLDLVSDFNLRQRQSQAAAERRFVDARLVDGRQELQRAETELAHFLEQNRQYQSSPRLAFEYQRLQRKVDLAQQVYLTLAKAYEEARIEEVRNTPVVTVVDNPEGSARRGESLTLIGLTGLMVGSILAVFSAFVRDYIRRERAAHPELYQEFGRLLARRRS